MTSSRSVSRPNWRRKAGLASPAPNVHRTLAKSCRTLAKSWTRTCQRQSLVSVGYGKLFFGPDFGHFPGFLDIFFVIVGSKMTDFEFGPECRPELFEVYLGILPGPSLGPVWAQVGPPGPWGRDLGTRGPGFLGPAGPWDHGTRGPGDRDTWDRRDPGTMGPWDPGTGGTGGTGGTLGPGPTATLDPLLPVANLS